MDNIDEKYGNNNNNTRLETYKILCFALQNFIIANLFMQNFNY